MRVGIAALALLACDVDGPVSLDGPANDLEQLADPTPLDLGAHYLESRAFRRDALVASLVDPTNGYSALRLERYAVPGGWDELPPWNPAARPVTAADLGAFTGDPDRPSTPAEGALAPLDLEIDWTLADLVELGARAFETYPLAIAPEYAVALDSPVTAADFGLWIDGRDRVGGLLRVDLGGVEGFATTCATCHARVDGGSLIHGAASPSIDVGRLLSAASDASGAGPIPPFEAWGPGHTDPTGDPIIDPIGIPDLRPIRHQRHLHAAATIDNSFAALVVRIDTLLITNGESRPPRIVALAIAVYLWSMGEPRGGGGEIDEAGWAIYDRECAGCHVAGRVPGEPVAAAAVGTDPLVAASPTRGTGDRYRTPSLYRVADRRRLLHLGQVGDLATLLDPARLAEVPGHAYGSDLDPGERAALIRFLGSL